MNYVSDEVMKNDLLNPKYVKSEENTSIHCIYTFLVMKINEDTKITIIFALILR